MPGRIARRGDQRGERRTLETGIRVVELTAEHEGSFVVMGQQPDRRAAERVGEPAPEPGCDRGVSFGSLADGERGVGHVAREDVPEGQISEPVVRCHAVGQPSIDQAVDHVVDLFHFAELGNGVAPEPTTDDRGVLDHVTLDWWERVESGAR